MLTSDAILAGLMKDPEFATQPEAVMAAIRPFIDAMPEENLGFFTKDMFKREFASLFASLGEMLEPLARDALAFLRENGVDEDEVMRGPQVGLVGEARSLYEAGKLTIGLLLEHQPGIIVMNKS